MRDVGEGVCGAGGGWGTGLGLGGLHLLEASREVGDEFVDLLLGLLVGDLVPLGQPLQVLPYRIQLRLVSRPLHLSSLLYF
jgi:hypothetical protein